MKKLLILSLFLACTPVVQPEPEYDMKCIKISSDSLYYYFMMDSFIYKIDHHFIPDTMKIGGEMNVNDLKYHTRERV